MDRARLEMHGREYWVVDEKSSTAKNKEGEIVRTQRVLAEPRPVASGDADLEGYTRTAENEISGRFPRLPNPTLVMFVFRTWGRAARPSRAIPPPCPCMTEPNTPCPANPPRARGHERHGATRPARPGAGAAAGLGRGEAPALG